MLVKKVTKHTNGNNAIEKIENKNQEKKKTQEIKTYKWNIVWRNVVLLSLVHLAGFYGIYAKYHFIPKWQSFLFNLLQVSFHGMGITAGRHRLWSHRCYKAHRSVEIFLATMAASVFEQSIFLWCRDHRLHHIHSDTDADPYNSRRGFFFSHIGWLMLRKHPAVSEKGATVDLSDLKANKIVMFEHKYNKILALIFTLILPCAIPMYLWDERVEIAVFYCCFWRFLLVLHASWSVNSFAHLYGWRPYDVNIQPVENIFVSMTSGGEGFHNYHHTFPWDYKAAELSGDTRNVTTTFIDMLARFGLVYDLRSAGREMIKQRVARTGDEGVLSKKDNGFYLFVHLLGIVLIL